MFNLIKKLFTFCIKLVFPYTLDRYIIKECWFPFLAGSGIVTGLWLGVDQIRDAFKLLAYSNADFGTAFSIVLLSMPTILLTTIPIGVFLACFLVFNRLSSDSEVVALRAGGISLARIVRPAVIFGTILCMITFVLGEIVVPWSQPLVQRIEFAARYHMDIKATPILDFVYFERDGGRRFGQGVLKRIFHVGSVDPNSGLLKKVTIVDFSNPENKQVYVADSALVSFKEGGWILNDCVTFSASSSNPTDARNTATFDRLVIPFGKSIQDLNDKISELRSATIIDLWEMIREHEKLGLETEIFTKLKVQFHEKIAFPFSCIFLAFVSAPMGLMPKRSRSAWGYVQIAVTIFIYFILKTSMGSIGETGKIDPFLAVWTSNFLLIAIGSLNLWHKSKFSS